MCSGTRSSENQLSLIHCIYKQPIRLNMAFTKPYVIANQRVITILCS